MTRVGSVHEGQQCAPAAVAIARPDGPCDVARWYNDEILASDDPAVRSSVLLVDDNADNLLALSAVLDRLKLRLVQATSGARALALAAEQEFAVIILDVQMPVLDGFETARLLRRRRSGGDQHADHLPHRQLARPGGEPPRVRRGGGGLPGEAVRPGRSSARRCRCSCRCTRPGGRCSVRRRSCREHALEAQRRESEARYQSLAEAVPLIVWTADVSGKITYANRAWTEYIGVPPAPAHQLEAHHPPRRPSGGEGRAGQGTVERGGVPGALPGALVQRGIPVAHGEGRPQPRRAGAHGRVAGHGDRRGRPAPQRGARAVPRRGQQRARGVARPARGAGAGLRAGRARGGRRLRGAPPAGGRLLARGGGGAAIWWSRWPRPVPSSSSAWASPRCSQSGRAVVGDAGRRAGDAARAEPVGLGATGEPRRG